MSDNENAECENDPDIVEEPEEKLFKVELAKSGRSKCKKCKDSINAGSLRIAKMVTNPFGSGKMPAWHHVACLFEAFKKQRATTPKIEKIDDMEGYELLSETQLEEVFKFLPDDARAQWKKNCSEISSEKATSEKREKTKSSVSSKAVDYSHKDNSLREFRKLCLSVANESSYLRKINIMRNFFQKGTDGHSFKGDLFLWCRLLLPGAVKTVYNLQSIQLVKIFSRIFQTDQEEMLRHLDEGDVALTVGEFFVKSKTVQPAAKSTLTLKAVDIFLRQLSEVTKENEQQKLLSSFSEKCTANDLQFAIRFIKHDLRINAGPKHVLEALHPDAYQLFKTCRDIDMVVKQITSKTGDSSEGKNALKIEIKLLTPVSPMLAEACSCLESAITKHPNGLYAETKYDGERVQLHKKGTDFKFFSRSLKPVMPHKVNLFKDFIPRAFPTGNDLILDCEVLMIDTNTGNPLPFGSLGIHKKNEFKDASPCLFVFDCLYFNGESLLDTPLKKRREILEKNMIEIPNHVTVSDVKLIETLKHLEIMLTKVLDLGLEGLVLKDTKGIYEPGKRRWIKVKRDYLFEGKAADSVDLIVLGAWYGTGNKGGMMSIFLMGCFNEDDEKFKSVTKVHGHDDETLKALQSLDMVKISRDVNKVPRWLDVTKTMIPDFVAKDPKKMPVWEIVGHEFTKHDVHTADGISMRFPRVMRTRDDKTWETATNLSELKDLYTISKTNAASKLLPFLNSYSDSNCSTKTTPTKKPRKQKENIKSNETTPDKIKRKMLPDLPLPNLLSGKRIKLEKSAANEEFRRHFIAYGAVITDETNQATHKVVSGSFSIEKDNFGEKILRIQLQKIDE
ncbi:DNA ligase 3 isoform X2 [Planococcus citri]|uniref:DNA ligase 3 isoform X2 n=1 Tax=Planococcus citri TaxID=170843 RepID=UPI0031F7641B